MKLLAILWCCWCPLVLSQYEPPSACTTPNGEIASCILLFRCPILISAAVSNDDVVTKFIQESSCGNENFMVCCGTSGNYTNKGTAAKLPESKKNATIAREAKRQLLTNRVYCGLQHTDDYFYNKTETSVDEFPWMVFIPTKTYKHDYYLRTEANCVGVLINNRYVLTHKDCNSPSVSIGQHHVYQEISCINTQYDTGDCTDPLVTEYVEDYISSETNNFALLRLKRKLPFSDFVRPICLPAEEDIQPKAGAIVITSGWDEEEDAQGKNDKIKKRIKHTIMMQEECENGNPVSHPICGERLSNGSSYVCPGDKGGAVMYRNTATKNRNWVALGIIAETSACAKHKPFVAERITPEIVDWILDKIKP